MEEEIDLREIILILWKSKYIIISITLAAMIIAAVFSLLLIPQPQQQYTATAIIDYQMIHNEALKQQFINQAKYFETKTAADPIAALKLEIIEELLIDSAEDLAVSPQELADNLLIESLAGQLVFTSKAAQPDLAAVVDGAVVITSKAAQPDLAVAVAGAFAEGLYFETLEMAITNLQEELLFAQKAMSFFDSQLAELYPEIDFTYQLTATYIDPFYLSLREAQGEYAFDYFEKLFAYEELTSIEQEQVERVIKKAVLPERPVANRWRLNTAVAGVLGFMLSVMIVFVCPHLASLKTALREEDRT